MNAQIVKIGNVKKIELDVIRPNGQKETVDVTNVPQYALGFPVGIYKQIVESTKKAGRGDVVECRIYHNLNNIKQLEKAYNDFMNEGGHGYIPEFSSKSKGYKEWQEVIVYN